MIQKLDALSRQINELLPRDFSLLKDDLKEQTRAAIHDSFKKMDLVTREEYEIQSRVLARTREKLEVLEQVVAKLEQQHKDH
ncbi:MAG TPA: accessory factor UbiK family protein [Ectothiorhodospiraceae bacterium]|nr:accessory factor UbiK family protein [Ectothiorhodospiraceae bacterium]